MQRTLTRFADGPLSSSAYAAVGAVVASAALFGAAATLSSSSTLLLGLATFFVGSAVASHRLSPRAKGRLKTERVESHCGCNGETKPQLDQEYVAVDPSRRARMVGWGSVGVAAAGALLLVVVLAL